MAVILPSIVDISSSSTKKSILLEEVDKSAKDLKEKTKKVISDEVKSNLSGKLKGIKKKNGF